MFFGVNTQHFMPHGHCIMWRPEILFPTVISDIVIFLSYTSIPVVLYLFQKQRKDLNDSSRYVLILFFLFIFLCGLTHAISAWNYWHSDYVLAMSVKILTAIVSFFTAIKLFQLLPVLVKIPSITDYEKVIDELRLTNDNLEQIVAARTNEIQEKNKLLETVFNGISEGIVKYNPVKDEKGNIVDFENYVLNENVEKQIGVNLGENVQVDSIKSFPGALNSGHFERCIKAYNEQSTIITDPSYNDEFKKYYREVIYKPSDQDCLIVYFTDVTDRENMKINKMGQTKLLALGELAGGIAHEINTPLQILSGYTRKVERSLPAELKAENSENFQVISNTLAFINKLIKNLKSLSQGDATKLNEIELEAFFEKSLFFVEKRITNNGINLIKDYENKDIKSIKFNEVSLFQIIINLVNNALDAIIENKESIEKPQISISVFSEKNNTILEIADNGPGIPEDIVERVFDPMFTTKAESKGTGLGLSLSRKLAFDMGAQLIVKQDKLTRFQLVINNE